jgi:hypothetical protein
LLFSLFLCSCHGFLSRCSDHFAGWIVIV